MSSINAITDKFGEKLNIYSNRTISDSLECREIVVSDQVSATDLTTNSASIGTLGVSGQLQVGGLSTISNTNLIGNLNMSGTAGIVCDNITVASGISNPNLITYVASASSLVELSLPTSPAGLTLSQVRYTRDEYVRYSADSSSYKSVWKGNLSFFVDHGNIVNQIMDFSINVSGIPAIFHNGTLLYVRGLGAIVVGSVPGHLVARNVDTSNIGLFNITFQTFAPYQVNTPAGSIYCECEFEVMTP